MAYDASPKELPIVGAVKDLFSDVSDLIRKELRLAKAEISEKVASRVQAGVWMGVAGVLALVAALVLIEALIFGIAAFGIGLHWASLIVAILLGAAAAGAFFYGRSLAHEPIAPTRTMHQINEDIRTAREQLT